MVSSTLLVYVGVIVVIIIMAFTLMMTKLINENSQCISNPLVYGASIIKSSGGEIYPSCQCHVEDSVFCACSLGQGGKFWFDENKIYSENPYFFNSPSTRS